MSYLASALFFYLWISAFSAFSAQSLPPLSSEVAKLEQGFVLENKEWGSWEDLFFLEDQELFILRQGVELFLLSATKNPSLQKVLSLERLDKTQILRATLQNGKFWLFLYSTGKIPFALEIFSGQIVEFPIEGLRLPGKQDSDDSICFDSQRYRMRPFNDRWRRFRNVAKRRKSASLLLDEFKGGKKSKLSSRLGSRILFRFSRYCCF